MIPLACLCGDTRVGFLAMAAIAVALVVVAVDYWRPGM